MTHVCAWCGGVGWGGVRVLWCNAAATASKCGGLIKASQQIACVKTDTITHAHAHTHRAHTCALTPLYELLGGLQLLLRADLPDDYEQVVPRSCCSSRSPPPPCSRSPVTKSLLGPGRRRAAALVFLQHRQGRAHRDLHDN